jgi:TRAP-type C4-dicarboxylate transport system substrate-binding protein
MRFAAALFLLLTWANLDAATGEVVQLIYASPYSPNHPFSRADQEWIEFVESHSAGKLHIRPIWSGALLSSDQSMTELRHGVADIGLITPIYAKGGAHLIRIQAGFYSGIKSVENQVALYRCMAADNEQFERELAGLKVLAVQGGNLPGIVTRSREIHTIDDLAGLRIRAPTELLELLRNLGADPVSMPMGEVYSALAKGIIDGVLAPGDAFKSMHFAEIAHHFTTLEIPRGAYPARAMGMRKWRNLSPDIQEILNQGIPVWEAALARQLREALKAGMDFARESGVEILQIDPQQQKRFDELYLREAETGARELTRFGIDGEALFGIARDSVTADGAVDCVIGRD